MLSLGQPSWLSKIVLVVVVFLSHRLVTAHTSSGVSGSTSCPATAARYQGRSCALKEIHHGSDPRPISSTVQRSSPFQEQQCHGPQLSSRRSDLSQNRAKQALQDLQVSSCSSHHYRDWSGLSSDPPTGAPASCCNCYRTKQTQKKTSSNTASPSSSSKPGKSNSSIFPSSVAFFLALSGRILRTLKTLLTWIFLKNPIITSTYELLLKRFIFRGLVKTSFGLLLRIFNRSNDVFFALWHHLVYPSLLPVRIAIHIFVNKPIQIGARFWTQFEPVFGLLVSAISLGSCLGLFGGLGFRLIGDRYFPLPTGRVPARPSPEYSSAHSQPWSLGFVTTAKDCHHVSLKRGGVRGNASPSSTGAKAESDSLSPLSPSSSSSCGSSASPTKRSWIPWLGGLSAHQDGGKSGTMYRSINSPTMSPSSDRHLIQPKVSILKKPTPCFSLPTQTPTGSSSSRTRLHHHHHHGGSSSSSATCEPSRGKEVTFHHSVD